MRESMVDKSARRCWSAWKLSACGSGSTRSRYRPARAKHFRWTGVFGSASGPGAADPRVPRRSLWTERELDALLHKETLIPVLHRVSFDQVAEYSGILPDLAGFETSRDSIEIIADKIAAAVIGG
jgi:hypothetical protein